MTPVDQFIGKLGLKYEDLTTAEREVYNQWNQTLDSKQLTVEGVRDFVRAIREQLEAKLSELKQESPNNWLGIAALFIPFYGLVKKWYADQERVAVQARLHNIILLEAFLIGPIRARRMLEKAMTEMINTRTKA